MDEKFRIKVLIDAPTPGLNVDSLSLTSILEAAENLRIGMSAVGTSLIAAQRIIGELGDAFARNNYGLCTPHREGFTTGPIESGLDTPNGYLGMVVDEIVAAVASPKAIGVGSNPEKPRYPHPVWGHLSQNEWRWFVIITAVCAASSVYMDDEKDCGRKMPE